MAKTIQETNEKIRSDSAVVFIAEEVIDVVRKKGTTKAARDVDVVTTGTFNPICSSGVFINIKQQEQKMKLGGGWAATTSFPVASVAWKTTESVWNPSLRRSGIWKRGVPVARPVSMRAPQAHGTSTGKLGWFPMTPRSV